MINSKVVNTINPNRTEFPKLMISTSNTIVLFYNDFSGISVVTGNDYDTVGEFSECWDRDVFTNFNGKVELSNV